MGSLLWLVAEHSVGCLRCTASDTWFCNGAKVAAVGRCLWSDGGTDGDLHVMAAVGTLLDGSLSHQGMRAAVQLCLAAAVPCLLIMLLNTWPCMQAEEPAEAAFSPPQPEGACG